jgi:hypothetical protein
MFAEMAGFLSELLIGKTYSALLDLKPDDVFEIKLGRKVIRLVSVEWLTKMIEQGAAEPSLSGQRRGSQVTRKLLK